MSLRLLVSSVLIVALLCGGVAPTVLGATDYSISTANDIDTPNRTVTIEGDEYEVSSVGQVDKNDTLTVNTESPSGTDYDIYIYNGDRDIVDTSPVDDDGSATFDTTYFGNPGSYLAAIYADGNIERIQPIVVSAYRVSADLPDQTTVGEGVTVDVSLSKITEIPDPHSVEVVVAQNDSVVSRVDASETDSLAYEASLSSDLDEGTYDVYAVVRNETTVKGKHELIGISGTQSLTVEKSSSEETSAPGDGGSDSETSAPGGGGSDSETSTPAATTATQTPAETTQSPSNTTTSATTSSPSTTAATSTQTPQTTTDDGVLTPNTESATPEQTSTSVPGPWLPALGVLLLGTTLAVWTRRSEQ
ncbi:cell surface glycoprotein [Haloferax elongans ATCC BAA-1513]|uniref:Cell surface glycoprotein n=1 Tax=Haloferax elongans ATCC BAA-1513 TaxID=1230453 RepID=M0HI47_HALEO|nr:hypothetical protein [Haloferax elongans]ELZ82769.1 cell surface glycoprotein [Haloferax elongans ATCC BAA-1513]